MKLTAAIMVGLLSTLLATTSCSTPRKNKVQEVTIKDSIHEEVIVNKEAAAPPAPDSKKPVLAYEINGDSDSNRAGTLRTVNFAFDSANLTPEIKDSLNNNIQFLKANPMVKLQVEGHCDERGTEKYNLVLGKKRAMSVQKYIVSRGIAKERVVIISYGESRPVAKGHDEVSWAKNRRSNFLILPNTSMALNLVF
jgi:peptidoglycan-associated lipoprotein